MIQPDGAIAPRTWAIALQERVSSHWAIGGTKITWWFVLYVKLSCDFMDTADEALWRNRCKQNLRQWFHDLHHPLKNIEINCGEVDQVQKCKGFYFWENVFLYLIFRDVPIAWIRKSQQHARAEKPTRSLGWIDFKYLLPRVQSKLTTSRKDKVHSSFHTVCFPPFNKWAPKSARIPTFLRTLNTSKIQATLKHRMRRDADN